MPVPLDRFHIEHVVLRDYADLRTFYRGARFTLLRARRADGVSVVIKQPSTARPELQAAERLRHEYSLLHGLDVPGVVRPLDLLTPAADGPALILEDAGRRSLAEFLRGRPLDVDAFFASAVRMAEIVRDLHARSVIHRDICPENFVVADDPSAVTLVDFETATSVPAFTEVPGLPGELEGTLAYMPPEQTGRIKRMVDRRADLYALGATFYEMLTGGPPFLSRDPLELVQAHAARAPHPPAVVNPTVPTVLSDIVVRLLAKMPEWRYQTAESLAADLREARHRWQARGEIAAFELGRHDVPYGLFLAPDKLYGREPEIEVFEGALARARSGPLPVLLVTGPAGIGKSALVGAMREVAEGPWRWAEGRGDALRGNAPYAVLAEALTGLVREALRRPDGDVAALRERLRQATAPNGRVLVEAIPTLAELLGDPPPVAAVGAREAENRFQLAFLGFLRALLADGPPVVLFLDDLQWADLASLKLLGALAAEPELHGLVVVCAYRSDEVGADDPVSRTVESIRAAGPSLTSIALGPLDESALMALLCNALRTEPPRVAALAALVRRKTAGNPFFIRQFLAHLYRRQLLTFAAERGQWTWDLEAIDAAEVTPNVVDLLSNVIGTLPDEAQQALRVAACIGNRFELGLVAVCRGQSLDEAAKALWRPLQQGLVVPEAAGPRFSWAAGRPVELGTALAPTYRFVHDRIQQAAYELLSEEERKSLHLRIGRWLEQNVPEAARDGAAAAIVDQLNRASERLAPAERVDLADLNRRAGRQARAACAYASSLEYFRSGLALLDAVPWSRADLHPLWFALQRGAAESAGLAGEHDLGERLVDEGVTRTADLLEKADLLAISVQANALRGAHAQALWRGAEGLALLGTPLPSETSPEVVLAEKVRAQSRLRERTDRQLLDAAAMDDPLDRARLHLLVSLSSAWFAAPELFQIASFRAAALTATRGLAPGSAVAFAYLGIALAMQRDYGAAYRYGRLAIQLAERGGNPAEECRALLCFGGHVSPWQAPMDESVPFLQRSHARGLESGDLEFAVYALANLVFARQFSGAHLDQVLAEAEGALSFCRRVHHTAGLAYVLPFAQAAKRLKGLLPGGGAGFDDGRFVEARFLEEAADNGLGQAMLHVLRLQCCYLLGEPELAHRYAQRSRPWLPYLRTLVYLAEFHFYAALTSASLCHKAPSGRRGELIAQLREHLQQLEAWAASKSNFRHKRDLVAAELARLEQRAGDALALYHRAIEQAAVQGFAQDEALAHALCGRFETARGATRMAGLHLEAAAEGYRAWGAAAISEALEREFPSLADAAPTARVATPAAPLELDYRSLLRAAETFTEELVFDRLLEKLVRTCAQAADAQRAVLVLDEGGLVIRATAAATGETGLEQRPIGASHELPISIVERVFASGELLRLADASRAAPFNADPFVAAHGVRSVLGVPLLHAGRSLGVLYFENNLASEAFTSERAEMLRLLSAQVAIALENSRLFEERQRSEAALRLLSEASGQLGETLDYRAVLAKVPAIAVPQLADWCIVDALEDGALRPVAWAHIDPSRAASVEELHRRYPVDPGAPQPQAQVLRSGRPLLVSEVTDELLVSASRDEENLHLFRALDPRSLMILPLRGRGRSIGLVTLATSHPTRRYDAGSLALGEELARRIGLALDNARLHRDLQEAAREREERDRYLQLIFRHLPGTVWATDPELRFTHANGQVFAAAARKATGATLYEFLGTRDPGEPAIAHHLAALAGAPQSFEYPFRGRWFAVGIDPLFDAEGRVIGCVGAAVDITARRRAAERLTRSEARLAEAQRVAHIGSFEWDINADHMTWSDELHRMYGLAPGQFAGPLEDFLQQLPPDDRDATRRAIIDAHREVRPFEHVHRVARADGALRTHQMRGDVIADALGNPIRVVGTIWDVTELNEATEARERLLSLLRATVEATADGILVVDRSRKVAVYNQRLLGLWRIPAELADHRDEERLLNSMLEQVEDSDAFLLGVAERYAHPEVESFDLVRLKDGRVFERYSRPQRIGESIVGRVWSFRDISERERLLHRALFLADATRLLASLDVEQALDGVAHLAVPYLGDGCAIDLFGDGDPRRLIAVSRDNRRPITPDVHPSVLGGHSLIYVVASVSYLGVPLMVKGNLIGALTLSAAAHRKYTAADLELAEELGRRAALAIDNARLYRRAQDALRARDEFLAIAAHEIRGPINSIHLSIQSMRHGNVPADALPRLFDLVERQDRRLSHFVDELLDIGRVGAGRLQLEYQEVNLGDVIRDVATRLGPDLARSGSPLTVTARGQVLGQWDRSRLDQVVTNLLSNAVKFGLGNPIEISVGADAGRATLTVKDHGIGVRREAQQRIFKPFERGVSSRHYGGLGLGLHIAKTIIDALGGSISVESEPGVGSTFMVELPLARAAGEIDAHPGS